MPRKPTIDDARLILELYDLRREAEMRKARHWWGGDVLAEECGRLRESGVGHGIGREQLAETGGRLLGNRRIVRPEWGC